MAEKAIAAIFGISVKVGVIAFIVAIGDPVLEQIAVESFRDADGNPFSKIELSQTWKVLLISLTMAYLAWQIPGMVAGMLTGTPSLNFGNAMAGATTLVLAPISATKKVTSMVMGTSKAMSKATNGAIAASSGAVAGAGFANKAYQGSSMGMKTAHMARGAIMGAGGAITDNKIERMKAAAEKAVATGRNRGIIANQ